jgi:hypothetical protein
MSPFSDWFEGKFLEWQNARKKHSTIREFSDWLGLDQRLVANLMRGDRKPGPEYADIISIKFGYDMTVYDLLGLPRPDKDLLRAKKKYPKMTPAQRKRFADILNEVEDDGEEPASNPGRAA